MNMLVRVEFNEADTITLENLEGVDRMAFLTARLAAQTAPALIESLQNGKVMGLLSPKDAKAIDTLIDAVQAAPSLAQEEALVAAGGDDSKGFWSGLVAKIRGTLGRG